MGYQTKKTKDKEQIIIDGEYFEVLTSVKPLVTTQTSSRSGIEIKSAKDLRDDYQDISNSGALRDFGKFVKA